MVLSVVVFMVIGAILEGLPDIVVLLPTMFSIVQKLASNPIYYVDVIIAAIGVGLFLPFIGRA